MYSLILFVHSLLRWFVIPAGVAVLCATAAGWRSRAEWGDHHDRLQRLWIAILDTQLMLGLVLYFALSPLRGAFWASLPEGMHNRVLRFWGMEHPVAMVAAILLLHLFNVRARGLEAAARHRFVFFTTLLCFAVILASIPWPFLKHGRPWLRML